MYLMTLTNGTNMVLDYPPEKWIDLFEQTFDKRFGEGMEMSGNCEKETVLYLDGKEYARIRPVHTFSGFLKIIGKKVSV